MILISFAYYKNNSTSSGALDFMFLGLNPVTEGHATRVWDNLQFLFQGMFFNLEKGNRDILSVHRTAVLTWALLIG